MTGRGSTVPAGAGEDLLRQRRGRDRADYRRLVRGRAGTGPPIRRRWRRSSAHRPQPGHAAGPCGELAAEYGVTAQIVPADLNRPGSPDQIVQMLAWRQTDVDVLANNAGF